MQYQDHMDVMNEPPGRWVRRLVQHCPVWLVKNGMFASVTWPYAKGRICMALHPDTEQTWYMDEDGYGFDKKRLILPVVGKLPETEAPLLHDDVILREISSLRIAVMKLNQQMGSPLGDTLLKHPIVNETYEEEKPLDWLF